MTGTISSDDTILCTAGVDSDSAFGSVMPPLYLSANFAFEGYGKPLRPAKGRIAVGGQGLHVPALAR